MAAIHTVADESFGIVKSEGAPLMAVEQSAPRAIAAAGGAGSIADMITFAIEKNVPVESLEKLFGLYERMAARDAAKEFNEALAAFRRECPSVRKAKTAIVTTRQGGEYSYTFADLPEIQRTVDPILEKHGFSYNWDSETDGKGLLKVACTLRHINGHSVSSSMPLPTESAAAMSPQQKYGAALTFGQRRTLANVLGIPIEDDNPEATKAVDPTRITEEQVAEIDGLLAAREADATYKKRFLAYMNVAAVPEIRVTNFRTAVAALKKKKEKSE